MDVCPRSARPELQRWQSQLDGRDYDVNALQEDSDAIDGCS